MNTTTNIQDLMDRAASIESSIRYYDHADGEKLARKAADLRKRAQALISKLENADARRALTRENGF